ncbi:hypothetical protein CO610_03635 [Lysobacteraceae bacterium NML95-0200]|nr:hypothetical protein CO610_03635 [Xanthomonadaceae bacterium NML95-0200]
MAGAPEAAGGGLWYRYGSWLLALGSWLLALGSWLLALGSWLLALGSWLLALGSWLLALKSSMKNDIPLSLCAGIIAKRKGDVTGTRSHFNKA